MKRTEIAAVYADAEALAEQPVQVCGWVRTLRKSKGLSFVELNDGSCLRNLQIVAEEAKLANFDELCRQNVGAALCVTGRLLLTPEAKQPCEIHAETVTVEGASTPDYPLQKKRHSLEYLRTIAAPAPARQHVQRGVPCALRLWRLPSTSFSTSRGFIYAHTPLITTSDCEGAGEMFHVHLARP